MSKKKEWKKKENTEMEIWSSFGILLFSLAGKTIQLDGKIDYYHSDLVLTNEPTENGSFWSKN